MTEKFCLDDWIDNAGNWVPTRKVKEFINLIQEKVLTNWKGQNEFVDWLKEKSGDKLK